MSEENVCAIMGFPMPDTYTEVRAFCGLSGHYHYFIRNLETQIIRNSEEGKVLFRVRNSFTVKKGMLYVNITPKGKTEGLLAFVVPSAHWHAALNGMH